MIARPIFETDQFAYALAGKEQRWSLGYDQKALPESLEVHQRDEPRPAAVTGDDPMTRPVSPSR